jgi:hypothetical protein
VFVQKVTRGFIAKRFVIRMKKKIKSELVRTIQLMWFKYVQRMEEREERRRKGAHQIVETMWKGVARRSMDIWCWFAESEKCRHFSIVVQKYVRRHLERESVR